MRVQFNDVAWGIEAGMVVPCDANVAVYTNSALTILAADVYSGPTGPATPGNPFVAVGGIITFFVPAGVHRYVKITDTEVPARFNQRVIELGAVSDTDNPRTIVAADALTGNEIAPGAVSTSEIQDATIGLGDLGFDPATQAEMDAAIATWAPLMERVATSGNRAAGTWLLTAAPASFDTFPLLSNASTPLFAGIHYIDPAEISVAPRTARLRLRATLQNKSSALGTSGANYTFGLYKVVNTGNVWDATTGGGALVAGSQPAVVNAPVANSVAERLIDFNCPAAGYYAIGVVLSGSEGINSNDIRMWAKLQQRQS